MKITTWKTQFVKLIKPGIIYLQFKKFNNINSKFDNVYNLRILKHVIE